MTHARAKREFLDICRNMQLNPEIIQSKDRHANLVEFRRQIVAKMMAISPPLSQSDVAYAINRDRSSIRHLMGIKK